MGNGNYQSIIRIYRDQVAINHSSISMGSEDKIGLIRIYWDQVMIYQDQVTISQSSGTIGIR
jgi:hypothetical protein